jgi:hypothetical protein
MSANVRQKTKPALSAGCVDGKGLAALSVLGT